MNEDRNGGWKLPPDDGMAGIRAFCDQAEELSTMILQHHTTMPTRLHAEAAVLKSARQLRELVAQLKTILPKN